jgi:tripartite-type tricarboxylate transporter receptor subunit TctC
MQSVNAFPEEDCMRSRSFDFRSLRSVLKTLVALAVIHVLVAEATAHADAVADFYKGKDIRFIISTSSGTGYDTYARTVARHLPRHLPGNPNIVPQYMPGAGGITAANYLYAVAPKDGTTFGMIQNTVPFEPLFANRAALFDVTKINWLGTPATEVGLYIVYHTSKIKTLQDAQTQEVIAGTTGIASTPSFYGRLFNEILHTKTRLVAGYPGQLELLIAMERGEIEAMTSPFWSSLKVERPTWYPQKIARLLFQYGIAPDPELKDVPFAADLLDNAADKSMLAAATASFGAGRPILAPPGLPADRLAALVDGVAATFKDPLFIADCQKQGIDCSSSRAGAQLSALIRQAYGVSDDIRKRLIAIQQQGQTNDKK